MTATTPRLLLPQLPPELRNEIYSYLSMRDSDSTPAAQFLPFRLKPYNCKHTSIKITPVHYGCTGLLALGNHRYLEADEYHAWLKNNALEIQIRVVFHGKINTFVQADWNTKIESRLRKVAKQQEWLSKAARYDVQIHWDPSDGMLKGRKKKPTGQIPRDIVNALTMLMDEKIKRKHGRVKVKLLLAHRIAVEHVLSGAKFGLGVLFGAARAGDGAREVVVEAWKMPHLCRGRDRDGALVSGLVPEKSGVVLASEGGLSGDVGMGAGHLLMTKSFRADEGVKVGWGDSRIEGGRGLDHILVKMMEDCVEMCMDS